MRTGVNDHVCVLCDENYLLNENFPTGTLAMRIYALKIFATRTGNADGNCGRAMLASIRDDDAWLDAIKLRYRID